MLNTRDKSATLVFHHKVRSRQNGFATGLLNTKEINPDVFIASTERGAQETAQIIGSAFERPIISDSDVEEWRSEDGSFSSEEFMRRWQELSETQKPF